MGHKVSGQRRKPDNQLYKTNQTRTGNTSVEQYREPLNNQYTAASFSLNKYGFNQALNDSLLNSTNPRPLALYICDDQSLATDIFNQLVLHSESISAYLKEQFILWKWSLTQENYHEFLTIVATDAGEEVAAVIDSLPSEVYPLLICLVFDRGEIKVKSVIHGTMSDREALPLLLQARDTFVAAFELPDTSGLHEFTRVAADFNGETSSIISIHRIENTLWLIQYLNQKQMIENRLGHNNTERLLFHGCPYEAAKNILQQAFDHSRIGTNGTACGHGFYFSSSRYVSDQYAVPNPSTGAKRMLMCRVLVGRSCQGNSTMTKCPSSYDSTTNGSDVFVVYSNRHILPEYLITYK
ncbi:unnamed protein product [Rotaria sp. Silwood2]|nr:unnamed protein product [Rotaria sp. Silwood2]